MANDITWSQLQTEIGVSGAIQIAAGVITINASILTGDTYTSINDDGVIEFVRKLVEKCYLTQVRINQGIEIVKDYRPLRLLIWVRLRKTAMAYLG